MELFSSTYTVVYNRPNEGGVVHRVGYNRFEYAISTVRNNESTIWRIIRNDGVVIAQSK